MEALSKILGQTVGSTFHLASNSHRTGDCPCKLMTSSISIWTAAETNDFDTLCSRISQNNALVSKLDAYGYTALHYAAQQNHIRIIVFLLSKGCAPDINSCGATPLHRAAYSGSFEACELLIKAGADVNAVDSSYRDLGSPLHKAYSIANVKIVNLLLNNGSNPVQLDAAGKIPQQLLKKRYHDNFPNLISEENIIEVNESNTDLKSGTESLNTDIKFDKEENEDGKIDDKNVLISKEIVPNDIAPVITVSDISEIIEEKRPVLSAVGLECSRCNTMCICFTRLMNGSLVCIDCKYNIT
jgi:ankyrin repeat protein